MKTLLALALFCGPVFADTEAAGIDEYTSDVDMPFSGVDPIVSADGYHFTAVVVTKTEEKLYVDAKKIADGEPGAFTRPAPGMFSSRMLMGAMSRDGKVAAHASLARDAEGRPVTRLGINGTPVGRAYADIVQIAVSPGGANVAFVAKTAADKHLVVSAAGDGPTVDQPPTIAGVSDTGIVYRLVFNGVSWVYRDHKAVPDSDFAQIAVTPDLSRVAGATSWTPSVVKVNGRELGRWQSMSSMRYTPAGDLVFLARTRPGVEDTEYDTLVINGREMTLPPFKPVRDRTLAIRPGDSVPFLAEDKGTYGTLRVGGRAMPEIGEVLPAEEWVAFSPSGRHWLVVVYRAGGSIGVVVDGKDFVRAPRPLKTARIIFDSETEFHYLADDYGRVGLLCGTIGGENSPRSVCARHGEALGKKNRFKLEALKIEPALKAIEPASH